MTLPTFAVGPPPNPQELRFWEWISLFWKWVRSFWFAAVTDLTALELRITVLESEVEELMAGIETLNQTTTSVLVELKSISTYLYELPRQLNEGTNSPATDDPETLRNKELQ